jgi:hypothetical protein
MKLTHRFAEMTPDKRPQDPHMDGTSLRFETLDHGGEYPDTMPQAIKLIDAEAARVFTCRSRSVAKWSTARGLCSMRRMNNRQSSNVPGVSENLEIGESPEPPRREAVQ